MNMNSASNYNIEYLQSQTLKIETNRIQIVKDKLIEDENRLSECIDDIVDLHKEIFLLPRTKIQPDDIKHHAFSKKKLQNLVNKPNDLINKSEDSGMFTPESFETESGRLEDESCKSDDDSTEDESILAKKAFSDMLINKEREIISLVKILFDKFLSFSEKVAPIKVKIGHNNKDVPRELRGCVIQLDELILRIHNKYSEMLDML